MPRRPTSETISVAGNELWRSLAGAGAKTTAETLSSDELSRMHINTPLDDFVADQIKSGVSVVLTGNAGDGKTHVLRRLRPILESQGAEVIEDATALMRGGSVAPVIKRCRAAIKLGRPFCLAANEYPLYQLRNAKSDFVQLQEISRQCRHRLAYGSEIADEEMAQHGVVVIDLSLRNPLVPSFVDALLDAILNDPSFQLATKSDAESTALRNLSRLSDKRVRERLRLLFQRMMALGHRATVRELWIMLAKMVFGSGTSGDYQRADWFSEVLFSQDPRFELNTALIDVDPFRCSHPFWDRVLEARSASLRSGWFYGEPAIPPHPDLSSESFAALKRAFYFEHQKGLESVSLLDPDAAEFQALLSGTRRSSSVLTSRLVDAVNAAYCPVSFSGREHHLYLWTGHRFHEQPSRSFIAAERVGVDDLSVEIPRLPGRIEGAFDYYPDHLTLVAGRFPTSPRLKIDFQLFQTLRRLGRGLPRKLVPERDVHRIDSFLEKLGANRITDRRTIWSVHLENLDVLQINLNADRSSYEAVRLYD
jgi:hypothetical protein